MIRDRITARASRASGASRSRDRMAEKGAVDIGTVDQATVRDDLGFKMTNDQYGSYQTEESEFNKSYNNVLSSNNSALEQYSKSAASLVNATDAPEPEYASGTSVDDAWNTTSQTFQTIRVVNGSNVEAVYKLPTEAIDSLNSGVFNQGDGSYTGNWVHDGIYNVDVTPRGIGDSYGKELHELVRGVEMQVQDNFYEEASPLVNTANQQVSDANTAAQQQWTEYNQSVATYNQSVADEKAKLSGYSDIAEGNIADANNSLALRNDQKARYKDQYTTSVKQRKALFS